MDAEIRISDVAEAGDLSQYARRRLAGAQEPRAIAAGRDAGLVGEQGLWPDCLIEVRL